MKPERQSHLLLGVTRSKAKMLEYSVPEEHHITIKKDPSELFTITIGLLGDLSAAINRHEDELDIHIELKSNLLFSARFFDAYMQSGLNEALDPYLVLLGSASYYLCDLPGSASVLANRINKGCPDLDAGGLESLLLWLLQADLEADCNCLKVAFGGYIDDTFKWVLQFFRDGTCEHHLINIATKLRTAVYETGTPRQLLFGDVIAAVLRKKIYNSSWKAIPLYSGLSPDKWTHVLQKESFIKELWPAQHLLGQANVLKGESAIVQMPTSAGKTKATELIVRSAFLAERTSLAIIIAPFRALCHEIKNSLAEAFHGEPIKVDELSDAMQADFEVEELLTHQQILIITPEKLIYVLRHAPKLASKVGLIVFDEGHQFDSGTRGITYELLLTSLRFMISDETQKVLISAVISNAEAIGEWLNGDDKTVDGHNLLPTYRSVAFASFTDRFGGSVQTGWMKYVDPQNADDLEYFVPQVIKKIQLERKKGESRTKRKYFPNQGESKEIAMFLGLKLVSKGAVAIFCGRKDTASGLCKLATERFSRNIPLDVPANFSDEKEVFKLTFLIDKNLGTDSSSAKSARLGIFSHHGNTPHGVRLSVEHAMRHELIHFVICTSTLAQGVNLPLRYLIVTGIYQSNERIKVRDFHNLIGRAGRAGMHTEGSILFADPDVHDKRKSGRKNKWRWGQIKELLDPSNSEPCLSNLLSIFKPIENDTGKQIITMEALAFAQSYISDPVEVSTWAEKIAEIHGSKDFTRDGVERQISWRVSLINAVESFLLTHWEESEDGLSDADIIRLAEGTLAFFLANDQEKENIRELFKLLVSNISEKITESDRRQTYGRTLYGLRDAQAIEDWVHSNALKLFSINNEDEALEVIWPLLTEYIDNNLFKKFDKPDVRREVALEWIKGKPFSSLLETIRIREAKRIWGTKRREFKIDDVVEICEGALAYDGALLIGAICEFIATPILEGTGMLIGRLQLFQKRLKYGLPTETTIALYELGFSDRVIAQDLAESLKLSSKVKIGLIKELKLKRVKAVGVIDKYPSYFQERMNELL